MTKPEFERSIAKRGPNWVLRFAMAETFLRKLLVGQPMRVQLTQAASYSKRIFQSAMVLGAVWLLAGCAVGPPPAAGPLGSVPLAGGSVPAVAATSPMTLPRYLGVESVAMGVRRVVYRSRLRAASYFPILQPLPPAAAPVAIGDPCCLQSASPAVATAAAIQQADAAAPAKVNAIGYLATMDICKNPQIEEAFLAAMDDPSECVRVAAVQGIIDATERCGVACNQCSGCCTSAIRQRLMHLAYDVDDNGCSCEPSPKVRRLARIAACRCNPTHSSATPSMPEELPSPAVLEMSVAPIVYPQDSTF
jgi:hypothetical protein